ncbi:RNA polymerase sigma factor [Desulfosporosinus lacus]|uniref:RNA polymerase sigma-70 factor, ECF subfamily n=1 Tax=Desulfosporosinus lacus DSM 15449 TaxID=1121420 RepID=A0A1M6B7D0_9FIRM|nr:sigma-70 family RNA polymerase sigma factor [Desulfosporosinus lacus]SHI44654.1 RNA polymerase sigma-70 factor, ECF subfamily [Desulfosporosinus lacus DSM 15449]
MGNTDLIKRCQMGDVNSFSELYQLHKKKALVTAYLISNQKGIAEDIVQESFIECFQKIKTIRNPEAFEAWFYKILVRTGWRMVKKYNYLLLMSDQNMEGLSTTVNFKSELDTSETNMMVHEALAQLSLPLKTVVILYYFNDMTIEKISKVLGCFPGTVKSRLYNARIQLHDAFKEKELNASTVNIFFNKRKEYGLDGNA